MPEDHHLSLPCGRPGNAVWTHQVQGVIGRQRGDATPEPERPKYALLPDGSLFIRDLEEADSGEFRCNDRLVAHVQVLSGRTLSRGQRGKVYLKYVFMHCCVFLGVCVCLGVCMRVSLNVHVCASPSVCICT